MCHAFTFFTIKYTVIHVFFLLSKTMKWTVFYSKITYDAMLNQYFTVSFLVPPPFFFSVTIL